MSASAVIEAYRKLEIQVCDQDVLAKLADVSKLSSYPSGTILFAEGEIHQQLYLVCEGMVALDMVTAKCGSQQILTVGPGQLLAWSGLLGDGRMTATAKVIDAATLIEAPGEALRNLCQADEKTGYAVMQFVAKSLSSRLLATRLQLLDLYHFEDQ